MDVVVVGRRAEDRWSLATALEQPAVRAVEPDLAFARLAHPASTAPEAVVLVVRDERDLAWCAAQANRSPRRSLPIVALVVRPGLRAAALAAGASEVVVASDGVVEPPVAALLEALDDVTMPAVVLDLQAVERMA